MGSRRRLIAWGLVVSLAYLGVVSASLSLGWICSRPLYDGLVPLPPYRWVNPPSERTQDNQVPRAETFTVRLNPQGITEPGSVTTSDGQATVTFDRIAPIEGESFVVTITPMDAAQVAGPPEGSYFDGNAYRVEAAYEGSQAPVEGAFTIVLRYSVHARQMLALKSGAWEPLFQPLAAPIDLQVSARTPEVGTFVASGKGTRPPTGAEHSDAPSPPTFKAYEWVKPPPGRASGNRKPATEKFTIRVDSFGQTDPESVATKDKQAGANFVYVQPVEGKSSFDVVIEPLDPGALAPPPPGKHFAGNAYRISAGYPDSDAPIAGVPSSVDMRYQGDAQQVLLLGESGWTALPDRPLLRGGQVISVRTAGAGTYVVAARGSSEASTSRRSGYLGWWVGLGSLIVLVAGAAIVSRRRSKVAKVETNPDLL